VILPFAEFPNPDGTYTSRPAADVSIEGLGFPVRCLIDSGAARNRFGIEIARAAGIVLPQSDSESFAAGGIANITTYTASAVQLAIADMTWTADVAFCDPWPDPFPNILGIEGFFRHFRVTVRATDFIVEVEPEDR
jgi:hypothetical protein